MMAPTINVNVYVQGARNPREFMESSDQIAAKLLDAIERGQRLR
ncbi:MAG TPA: hypothetical protein VJ810_13855 [Blastocatellia bacterium]|nr:hypothetical protein [Blastocatellia bacterium]